MDSIAQQARDKGDVLDGFDAYLYVLHADTPYDDGAGTGGALVKTTATYFYSATSWVTPLGCGTLYGVLNLRTGGGPNPMYGDPFDVMSGGWGGVYNLSAHPRLPERPPLRWPDARACRPPSSSQTRSTGVSRTSTSTTRERPSSPLPAKGVASSWSFSTRRTRTRSAAAACTWNCAATLRTHHR